GRGRNERPASRSYARRPSSLWRRGGNGTLRRVFDFGASMRGFWRLACGVVALLIAASALAADPGKVLRIAFPVAETGFDPVKVSDIYSNTVNEAIFDT